MRAFTITLAGAALVLGVLVASSGANAADLMIGDGPAGDVPGLGFDERRNEPFVGGDLILINAPGLGDDGVAGKFTGVQPQL